MLNIKKSIVLIFTTLIFSVYFCIHLNIANTPLTYVPSDLKSYQVLKKSEKYFRNDETLIFVFKLSSPLAKNELRSMATLVDKLSSIDRVNKIYSIFDYESIRGTEEGFQVFNILDRDLANLSHQEKVKKDIHDDRFIKDLLVNKDLDVFTIVIEPEYMRNSIERYLFEKKVFDLIHEVKLNENQQAYGGDFAIDMVQFEESISLALNLIPIVIITGLVLIYMMFNSIPATVLAGSINGLGSLFTVGLLSLFKFDYNLVTSVVPTLMLALSTAFVIHLYNAILRFNKSMSIDRAIEKAYHEVQKPSLFSAITTAIGLFSLGFSSIPPIKAVGIVCGLGVLFIYVLVIHFLPAFLKQFCSKNWNQIKFFNQFLDKIVFFTTKITLKHPRKIILVFVGSVVILSTQILKVESETNMYRFFDDNHKINKSINYIKNNFVGVTNINVLFTDTGTTGENSFLFTRPEFHQRIDSAKGEILNIKDVDRVFSATDIIKQINWAFNGEKENSFVIPDSQELLEQYIFIYDGEDLFDNLDRDLKHMKMTINISKEGANDVERVFKQVKKILDEKLDSSSVLVEYTGYGKMFADQENLVLEDLYRSIFLSSFSIFIVMVILWRSLSDSFFCMIPNFSPIAGMFIIMGMAGIWLDIGTAMIASIALGIAVDDTIHIFAGLKQRLKSQDVESAISDTFADSGRAIITTTLILSSQFMILTFSEFKPLQHFGFLTSVGLFIALIFDLMLLPAIMIVRMNSKKN